MKKLIVLFVLLLYGVCFGNPHGLIAHYKLNDNADSNAVLDDTASHNGIFKDATGDPNTSAHTTTGKIGAALTLDGTDDYIEVADHNDFTFGDGTNDSPFSISAWVYMDDAKLFGIFNKYQTGQLEYAFGADADGTALDFYLYDGTTGYMNGACASFSSAYENAWTHIVGTYDGSSGQDGLKIYINGTSVSVSTLGVLPYTAMGNTTADVEIGIYHPALGPTSNGKIDNVMIFSKELSADEIKRLYNNGHGTEIIADLDESRRIRRRIL